MEQPPLDLPVPEATPSKRDWYFNQDPMATNTIQPNEVATEVPPPLPQATLLPQSNPKYAPDPELPGSGQVSYLVSLDRCYLLAVAENGLLIVDQHAAHERVLFERLLKVLKR